MRPMTLPVNEAAMDQAMMRKTAPPIDKVEAYQHQPYQALDATRATARNRAPMAQPQLSGAPQRGPAPVRRGRWRCTLERIMAAVESGVA
jgi:hypothetical protein